MIKIIAIIIGSFVGVTITILALIVFKQDIANLFGVSSTSPSNISILKDLITPLAASFGGAIAGALVAFKLQNDKEKKKEIENEINYLNSSLLALEAQINDLTAIKKQSILKVAKNPLRFMEIRPLANVEHVSERIDLRIIPGLTRLGEAELIQESRLAERRYLNVINTLKKRDSIIIQIHNLTASAGINTFDTSSLAKIYSIIGPSNLAMAYETTEEYIKLLDDAIQTIKSSMTNFNKVFDIHYKDSNYRKLAINFPKETVFEETIPPIIKNAEDLLKRAGHKSQNH